MKAIETSYKGYKFRSRLEARWAVFFDALDIEWEYEPEGFEFEDGTRYLPDFRLSYPDIWFEVKGPEPDDEETRKAELLFRGSGKAVVVASGSVDPWEGLRIFCNDLKDSGGGEGWHSAAWSVVENGHRRPALVVEAYNSDRHFLDIDWQGIPGVYSEHHVIRSFVAPVVAAMKKARSARFEHGERP